MPQRKHTLDESISSTGVEPNLKAMHYTSSSSSSINQEQNQPNASKSKQNTASSTAKDQALAAMPLATQQAPQQQAPKKKRVVRACDECRRKKVKCDGQQPCIHCTVYSYECTYNQPTIRRRPTAATANSSNSDQTTGQPHHGHAHSQPKINQSNLNPSIYHSSQNVQQQQQHQSQHNHQHHHDDHDVAKKLQAYEAFVHNLLPDVKDVNIHKLNSVLAKLKTNSNNTTAALQAGEISKLYHSNRTTIGGNGDSPSQSTSSSMPTPPHLPAMAAIDGSFESQLGKEIKIILPPKDIAVKLISSTWDNSCVLFRFYHRPSFIKQLSILYETDPMNYTDTQQKFLPLVYSVMACGSLFYKSSEATQNSIVGKKNEADIFDDEGYKYFIAARKLIDITDTRDIYGIQTIVMLVLFLQCGARLSTCYSYVGIGLRAALREGFHRRLKTQFDPIQLEVRKRIFWTMYKMDIYVNAMLGLPMSLNDEDFDQELPMELDDENITESGYNFENQKYLSSSAIANSHTKLLLIMKKVVQALYPVNKKNSPPSSSNNIVYNLELDLQNWVNELPLELKPGIEPNQRYFKANRLLHFSYLHIKIILYRPFIHYISADFKNSTNLEDLKSMEKAKNCINVARIVVKLSQDMIAKNMLSGSYWFSVYTIFFSVACLVYYVHFGPGILDDEYMAVKADAEAGKNVLEILKNSTTAARRTFDILNSVFEQMNRRTAERRQQQYNQHTQAQTQTQPQAQVHQQPQSHGVPQLYPKEENEAINKIVNGVNYIDGKGTGISLNMSIPTPTAAKQGFIVPQQSQEQQQQQEQNFSSTILPQHQAAATTTTGIPDISSVPAVPSLDETNGIDVEVNKYVPGMIDRFDEKIFGKFLPPYMDADFTLASQHLASELIDNNNDNNSTTTQNRDLGNDPMQYEFDFPAGVVNDHLLQQQQSNSNDDDDDADDKMFTGTALGHDASGLTTTTTTTTTTTGTNDIGTGGSTKSGETTRSDYYNFDELLNEWAHDTPAVQEQQK